MLKLEEINRGNIQNLKIGDFILYRNQLGFIIDFDPNIDKFWVMFYFGIVNFRDTSLIRNGKKIKSNNIKKLNSNGDSDSDTYYIRELFNSSNMDKIFCNKSNMDKIYFFPRIGNPRVSTYNVKLIDKIDYMRYINKDYNIYIDHKIEINNRTKKLDIKNDKIILKI